VRLGERVLSSYPAVPAEVDADWLTGKVGFITQKAMADFADVET